MVSSATATTPPNTWTKGRNGDWLVRGRAGQIGANGYSQAVNVSKRDGSTTLATIVREVWTDGQVALYAVALSAPAHQPASRRTGCACGSIDGQPRKSDCFSCRMDND